MINRTLTVFFYGSMAYCLFLIAAALTAAIGPVVEKRFFPPVVELYVQEARCDGVDVVLQFYLDKRAYPGDVPAETLAFNVRTTSTPARNFEYDGEESGSFTAPSGEQIRGVRIFGACNTEFKFRTRHKSPITGLPLVSRFGSFGPYNPGVLYRRIGGALEEIEIDLPD